jgi:hypothetical protein
MFNEKFHSTYERTGGVLIPVGKVFLPPSNIPVFLKIYCITGSGANIDVVRDPSYPQPYR